MIREIKTKTPDYTTAHAILGDDFISPDEIATSRGLTYTPEQLVELECTLPNEEALKWCHANGFMLVAGPSSPMSLLDIRKLDRGRFSTRQGGWYSEVQATFARDDKVVCHWLMLRKQHVTNSVSKEWDEQRHLLSDLERVPNAAEQAWGMTTYTAVRSVHLLIGYSVRTSSIVFGDLRVCIGSCDHYGLDLTVWPDNAQLAFLDTASARKS